MKYDKQDDDRFFDPLDTVGTYVVGGLIVFGILLAIALLA